MCFMKFSSSANNGNDRIAVAVSPAFPPEPIYALIAGA
jgi:hypothetical protein